MKGVQRGDRTSNRHSAAYKVFSSQQYVQHSIAYMYPNTGTLTCALKVLLRIRECEVKEASMEVSLGNGLTPSCRPFTPDLHGFLSLGELRDMCLHM